MTLAEAKQNILDRMAEARDEDVYELAKAYRELDEARPDA